MSKKGFKKVLWYNINTEQSRTKITNKKDNIIIRGLHIKYHDL